MRRFSLPMFALILISLLTGCGVNAGTTPKIRIGVDPKLPPFETTLGKPNEYAGFDIDLMNALAQKAGFEFEYFNAGSNLTTLVGQCKLEAGISALPILPESMKIVDFSDPYYSAGLLVVVKKGNITIGGREQLGGMTVAYQEGTVSEAELEKIAGVLPKKYQSLDLAFRDLANGYLDAVVADSARALSYVEVRRNNLKIVGPEFSGIEYSIITCKEQTELLAKINTALAALKSDGTLEQLAQKWGIYRGK